MKMVYDLVEDRGGLEMLNDERLVVATADISGVSMTKAEVRHGETYNPSASCFFVIGVVFSTHLRPSRPQRPPCRAHPQLHARTNSSSEAGIIERVKATDGGLTTNK